VLLSLEWTCFLLPLNLPKEGDERLLTNRHAILKPRNLPINLPDAEQINVLVAVRIDAGRIDVQDDTRRPDALDVVKCLRLNANDVADTRQPDAGQPDTRQIFTLLTEAYQTNPLLERILGLLHDGTRQCKEISLADCKELNSRLLYRDRIYVPDHTPLWL